jgi:hypothetical protein
VSENCVIIVHLRRPRSKRADPKESRSDPFWEFGSFGITGCHRDNLMNLRNEKTLKGVRLAFAQGGKEGTRLVYLSPPVEIVPHRSWLEAQWSRAKMPFRYDSAPILVSNTGKSDFPALESALKEVKRSTLVGKFASKYRSSATCLDDKLANELVEIYEKRRADPASRIAGSYVDALPWPPPLPDGDRKKTYEKLKRNAGRSKRQAGGRKHC